MECRVSLKLIHHTSLVFFAARANPRISSKFAVSSRLQTVCQHGTLVPQHTTGSRENGHCCIQAPSQREPSSNPCVPSKTLCHGTALMRFISAVADTHRSSHLADVTSFLKEQPARRTCSVSQLSVFCAQFLGFQSSSLLLLLGFTSQAAAWPVGGKWNILNFGAA